MITSRWVSNLRTKRHHAWFGGMALYFALQCFPAFADQVDDAAKSNVVSSPQAEISWISGGVGDEAMTEMHKQAKGYNVHVLMTGRRGHYLAGIPFTISRRNGQMKVSGLTEGPLLYLKLPPASYQIAVEIDGKRQTRQVQTSAVGQAIEVRFIGNGE